MTDDPFAALLGEPAAEPEKPRKKTGGRPTREEAAAKLAAKLAEQTSLAKAATGRGLEDVGGVQALRRPVTINTLATIFEHDVQTITRRLIDCPFEQVGNRRLYAFKEACSYIVKPRMTPEQFVKTLNKADLPPEINLAFWNAQRAKIKFMLEAQEAWETEEVLEVFGDTFMTIKDHLQMAEEEMRERAKLTDAQARQFADYMDEMRTQLRDKLVDAPKHRQTTSLLDRPMFGSARDVAVGDMDFGDDEEGDGE